MLSLALSLRCLFGVACLVFSLGQLRGSPAPNFSDPFANDRLLVDFFGLGSFAPPSSGDFQLKLYRNSVPASYSMGQGVPPPPSSSSPQFSGRPGWGGGAAATLMLGRFVGVSVDQSMFGRAPASSGLTTDFGYIRNQTSGALVVRFPIPQWSVAPYGIIGGGAQYGNVPNERIVSKYSGNETRFTLAGQGFGQLGGGVDLRVFKTTGAFADLRWLYSSVPGLPYSQMQFRYGIRMIF